MFVGGGDPPHQGLSSALASPAVPNVMTLGASKHGSFQSRLGAGPDSGAFLTRSIFSLSFPPASFLTLVEGWDLGRESSPGLQGPMNLEAPPLGSELAQLGELKSQPLE